MMKPYAFVKELGLELRDTYPVMRDGKRVDVKTSELTDRELLDIQRACNDLSLGIGRLLDNALQRAIKQLWEMNTPLDREQEITNPAIQYKIRGKGWLHWNDLTPKEQAKIRADHEARMAKIQLTPREHAEAMRVRAIRMAQQNQPPQPENVEH